MKLDWCSRHNESSPCPICTAISEGKNPIEPEHYTRLKPEPLDVIEAWGLAFHEAQVLKYISRAGVKGGEEKRLEDLKKAAFYLNRRIKQLGG